MKKSVAMKWVKALRSGKYKQGKHRLRDGDKYCCLGVLCDISKVRWQSQGVHLPLPIMQWAGMRNAEGVHRTVFGVDRSLTGYNDRGDTDGTPCTFEKIADWIEVNYKAL